VSSGLGKRESARTRRPWEATRRRGPTAGQGPERGTKAVVSAGASYEHGSGGGGRVGGELGVGHQQQQGRALSSSQDIVGISGCVVEDGWRLEEKLTGEAHMSTSGERRKTRMFWSIRKMCMPIVA